MFACLSEHAILLVAKLLYISKCPFVCPFVSHVISQLIFKMDGLKCLSTFQSLMNIINYDNVSHYFNYWNALNLQIELLLCTKKKFNLFTVTYLKSTFIKNAQIKCIGVIFKIMFYLQILFIKKKSCRFPPPPQKKNKINLNRHKGIHGGV